MNAWNVLGLCWKMSLMLRLYKFSGGYLNDPGSILADHNVIDVDTL